MITHFELSRELVFEDSFKTDRFQEVLFVLRNNPLVKGVLLGGSISYKIEPQGADVDLFCLTKNTPLFEQSFQQTLRQLKNIEAIIFQEQFAWTGKLHTIYFDQDPDFTIDLGLVPIEDVGTFFWEPQGQILWDDDELITKNRSLQMARADYTKQPFLRPNPFSMSIVALKKIGKNLSRNHLWNALEQLNILRRYAMQIIRMEVIRDHNFLGRVDREIEDILPVEMNSALASTVARYDPHDIASKAVLLAKTIESLIAYFHEEKEGKVKQWIIKQLSHENLKLNKYIN